MTTDIQRMRKIAGISEEVEQKDTEFSAYSIDTLISKLQEIKRQYGNVGIAGKTYDGKWNTEGISITMKNIHAYNQTSMYACISELD